MVHYECTRSFTAFLKQRLTFPKVSYRRKPNGEKHRFFFGFAKKKEIEIVWKVESLKRFSWGTGGGNLMQVVESPQNIQGSAEAGQIQHKLYDFTVVKSRNKCAPGIIEKTSPL
jgi:hypothetical protein